MKKQKKPLISYQPQTTDQNVVLQTQGWRDEVINQVTPPVKKVNENSLWYRLKEKYHDIRNIYLQIKLDNRYRREFAEGMSRISQDTTTQFFKLGLKYSEENETISYLITLPEEFAEVNSEMMVMDRLQEETFIITKYLREQLGLNFYISLPDYFHIEDVTSNQISLAYLAVWHFQPMVDDAMKKKYLRTLYMSEGGIGLAIATSLMLL